MVVSKPTDQVSRDSSIYWAFKKPDLGKIQNRRTRFNIIRLFRGINLIKFTYIIEFCADVKQTADHGKTDSTREKTALFSRMSDMSQGIWFEVPWNPHVSLPGKTKKQLGSGKINFLFKKKNVESV